MTGGLSPDPHLHAVTFYDHDREVVAQVARFVADGIHQQGLAIVVATPEHRTALVQALLASGLDPADAPVAGRLVMLDARTTLDSFMTDAGPDPDRFAATVEQIVRDAGSDGAPVRVFGEMVGLLWAEGDIEGAIALEAMWNGLLDRVDFVLLCAYSSLVLETGGLTEIHAVCGQHSNVQGAPAVHRPGCRPARIVPRLPAGPRGGRVEPPLRHRRAGATRSGPSG